MEHGKRSISKRHYGSSLALLESLAYDSNDDRSARSSSRHSHASSHSRTLTENASQNREAVNWCQDRARGSTQERGAKWGWESRLREAEEDLRQLRRRSKSVTSLTDTCLATPTDVPESSRASTEYEVESKPSSRTKNNDRKRGVKRVGSCEQITGSRELVSGNGSVPGQERLPGFGDRWASSVLLEELMSLKKELQASKDREASLKKRLEEAERDKDNVCRLWEEDRAKMLGMKLSVENAFIAANEQLRERLSHRTTTD